MATQAILESGEFKELAKNPAFQQLLQDSNFTQLAQNNQFLALLADPNFRKLAQDDQFRQLVRSEAFSKAIAQGLYQQRMSAALQNNAHYQALADSKAFDALMVQYLEPCCAGLFQSGLLQGLLGSNALRQSLKLDAFAALAARSEFKQALQSGSAAQMAALLGSIN